MGAYAAHGIGDSYLREITTTAVRYHMWHTLAIIAAAFLIAAGSAKARWLGHLAAALFLTGILCFGGAIYVHGVTGENPLGFLAPAGGWALMGGWLCFAVAGFRFSTNRVPPLGQRHE